MFCIKHIEFVEVRGDHLYNVAFDPAQNSLFIPEASHVIPKELCKELIMGRMVVRNNKEYCFGFSKQVEEAIGISWDLYDQREYELDEVTKRNKQLEKSLAETTGIISSAEDLWDYVDYIGLHHITADSLGEKAIRTFVHVVHKIQTFYENYWKHKPWL